jgi:hypothetical protein
VREFADQPLAMDFAICFRRYEEVCRSDKTRSRAYARSGHSCAIYAYTP